MTTITLARLNSDPITRIDSASPKVSVLSDLWRHRYLLWTFTWRDIKVRYKQTFLGAAWAALQPLFTMLVFTLVFSRMAKVSSGHTPYPVFVLAGLLPWQFFAYGLIRSSNSLVEHRYLLTKVPVPRLTLPVSSVLGGAPDFAVALSLLFGIMAYYRIWPSLSGLLVVPLIAAVASTALSLGLLLAAVHVRYRDVGFVIPFFTQLLFFVTPVAYPISLVPQRWRLLYSLNPMTAVVEAFRYALLPGTTLDWQGLGLAGISVCFLFVVSLSYFQRMERTFADVV
jgi:lipopolysaccharide transport system permease protein